MGTIRYRIVPIRAPSVGFGQVAVLVDALQQITVDEDRRLDEPQRLIRIVDQFRLLAPSARQRIRR